MNTWLSQPSIGAVRPSRFRSTAQLIRRMTRLRATAVTSYAVGDSACAAVPLTIPGLV